MNISVKKGLKSDKRIWNIVILIISIFILLTYSSFAAVPRLINYQGKLATAAGIPLTGNYKITFKIYNVDTGGVPLWTEIHNLVNVDKGLFNILLGSVTTLGLDFSENYWLSTEVESDGEMSPRQQIVSVGYSIRADTATNADKIDGFHASQSPSANQIPVLDNSGKLPAIDGSKLMNLPALSVTFGTRIETGAYDLGVIIHNTSKTQSITFNSTFTIAPTVLLTAELSIAGTDKVIVTVRQPIATTGFGINATNVDVGNDCNDCVIHWIAIGK